jgi:glycerol-3-phosphate dehydrogenase
VNEGAELDRPLHPQLPFRRGEIAWAARYEMARCVEDVLARRTRALFLNAQASIEAAPVVARILSHELGHNAAWEQNQLEAFRKVAEAYVWAG